MRRVATFVEAPWEPVAEYLSILANIFTVVLGSYGLWVAVSAEAGRLERRARGKDRRRSK